MVWWRTLLKVVVSVLLVASLVFCIMSFSFSQTLSVDNLKPVFIDMFKEQIKINETELVYFHSTLVQNCTATGAEIVDVPLGEGPESESVALECADVIASSPSGLIDLIADAAFDKVYYEEYECSFIDCITEAEEEEQMLIFMSEFASQSFRKISNIFLIAIILFIILAVLLCVPKYTAFMTLGIDFIVAGLPFFLTNFMKTGAGMPAPFPEEAMLIFAPLFSYMSTYFLATLITGIVLLAVGIFFIFWKKKKLATKQRKQ